MKIAYSRGRPLVVLAAALWLAGCGQDEGQNQGEAGQAPAKPVEVAALERQDVPLDKSYPSKLTSDEEVILVARVTGIIEERRFEPGDVVEKGQSLYSIEPDLYQATVNERKADLESAQAQKARAESDATRYQALANQNSVSRQQLDQALADARVARANVAQAQAALETAQLDLNYAAVKAPVSGLIGLSEVNIGNLVSSGTELTTITPLDPLEVRFQLPQADAFEMRRQLKSQSLSDIKATLEIPGLSGGESGQLQGQMDFLGSRVDPSTSTVQAQAKFANPEGHFLPGQFVRVRLSGMKRYNVLAVPELALTQGLMGPQVYVLDQDNTARARPVQLGEEAGPWQILLDGVKPGERVIVGDPASIQPGMPIDPQPFDGDAAALMKRIQDAKAAAEAKAQGGGAAPAAGAGESQAQDPSQEQAPAAQSGAAEAAPEGNAESSNSDVNAAQQAPMSSGGDSQEAQEAQGEGNE
ncbi:efflux RND transporter periplasmic adaptor subunit [Halomonas binhaiensis]|uniref:Efflux RND transporter periplasmic adaptor subunit n=1 Tax=Halomonas binhaiensis TaxID=2562282 RepID=A0A5C1NFC5_9GAMM|nr:efflux RND transporter periplasmic adaptor subunit [Halomonas binhaiensis]QEM82432.1 efflux RND transporter periplasmic adaptor subunit [Halomonas binhaiensis]